MSEPLTREQLEDALAAELVSELDFDDVCGAALHYLDRFAELEKDEALRGPRLQALADMSDRALAAEAGLAAAREALKWYADENNWTQPTSWGGRIMDDESAALSDCGNRARDVLARGGGQQDTG